MSKNCGHVRLIVRYCIVCQKIGSLQNMEQCAIKELIEELMKISDASSQFKDLHQRCKDLEGKAKLLHEHIIVLH